MLSITMINEMMGVGSEGKRQAEMHRDYLIEHKTKFMEHLQIWLHNYGYSELHDKAIFLEGYYDCLVSGNYEEEYYRQQYRQIIHWYRAGLNQVRVTLLLNKCRNLFFNCDVVAKTPSLGIYLSHALDIGQIISANIYGIAALMDRMQQKFHSDVSRLGRSYGLVEAQASPDLMQAYQDHVNWKLRAFSLALGEKIEKKLPLATDECRLGEWLESGGWERIPETEKTTFQEAHEAVHKLGAQALANAKNTQPENIVDSLTKMEQASDKVASVLIHIMEAELLEYATLDGLTKLPNRKVFDERLEQNIAFAKRNKMNIGLILIDVDHFKKINDTRGHLVGDQVLRELAVVLNESLREEETAYRWGGEEFAIMTMGQGVGDSAILAERIREKVEEAVFCEDAEDVLKVTVSCGSVSFQVSCDFSMHQVFAHVDMLLYQAKNHGRNRVEHQTLEVK